jgi:hypothetical protein
MDQAAALRRIDQIGQLLRELRDEVLVGSNPPHLLGDENDGEPPEPPQ